MSSALIGVQFSQALTSAEQISSGRGCKLKARSVDSNGNEWIYVKGSSALPQYSIVTIRAEGTATPFSSAAVAGGVDSAFAYGNMASSSVAADGYGWAMIRGRGAVKVSASSTGTISGQLYAAASANAGWVQTTASGGVKLTSLFAVATATTSTTASAIPVNFGYMLTSA